MRPFLMLLLAARLYAANCGGIVTLEDGQPAPGARVLFVPFESGLGMRAITANAQGAWTCPADLRPGRYMVGGLGQEKSSSRSFDLTVDPSGVARLPTGNPSEMTLTLRPRPVTEPTAPVKPENPATLPPSKVPPPSVDREPANAKCEACAPLVDIVLTVAETKENGDWWDESLRFREPELVMVLAPVPDETCAATDVRLPRPEDTPASVQFAPFAEPNVRGCQTQAMTFGSGDAKSLHCASGYRVAFKNVPLPSGRFRVFVADIDLFRHDLVFEHSQAHYRIQCGDFPCENQNHVSADEFCEYRPDRSPLGLCNLTLKSGFRMGRLDIAASDDKSSLTRSLLPTEVASRILADIRTRNAPRISQGMWTERGDALLGAWKPVFDAIYEDFEKSIRSGGAKCRIDEIYRLANEAMLRAGPLGIGALDDLSFLEKIIRAFADKNIEDGTGFNQALGEVRQKLVDGAAEQFTEKSRAFQNFMREHPFASLAQKNQEAQKVLNEFRITASHAPIRELAKASLEDDVLRRLLASGRSEKEARVLMSSPELFDLLSEPAAEKHLARASGQIHYLRLGAEGLGMAFKALDIYAVLEKYGRGPGADGEFRADYQRHREQLVIRLAARVEWLVEQAGYSKSPRWTQILLQRFREINEEFALPPLPLPPP